MATYLTDKRNTSPAACRNCGMMARPGQLVRGERWDYDWDNPDEDAQGSIQVLMESWWEHPAARIECIEESLRMGHNYEFIRAVAQDNSQPTDVRERARTAYNEMVEAMRGIARANDLAARENGYGVSGGPRGE